MTCMCASTLYKFILLLLHLLTLCLAYTPPKLTQEPQDVYGVEGNPLTLSCRASGDPPPQFVWMKDKNEIEFSTNTRLKSTNNGDLIIDKFDSTQDPGKYRCIVLVSNSNGDLKLLSREASVKAPGKHLFSSKELIKA